MIRDYLSLSFGNLKHRGLRSWLTMLGIFIGIAAVVSLILLGQGLREAITGQFSSLSTDRLVVQNAATGFGPPGATAVKKLTEHDVNVIEKAGGIKLVIPRLLRLVKMSYNEIDKLKYAVSMPNDKDKIDSIYEGMNIKLESGKTLSVGDFGKVILGHDFVDKNDFDKEIRVGSKITLQGKNFEVIGILKKASTFTVNSAMLMMEDDMKSILNIKDEYDLIGVQVQDSNNIQSVADEISNDLRKDRHEKVGEEDFTVQTPLQALGAVNTILNIINFIVAGIAAISLFVGGVGIANTMYTSVLERKKEIGVMKAIGAKNKDILIIFMIESGLLGLAGGIVGALIGVGFAFTASSGANAYFGSTLLVLHVSWPLLFGAIAFSFLIGAVSGVLPAIQASKLKPVEALRG